MTIIFSGKAGVDTYRAIAIRSGLRLYIKCGMKPNRAWTPTNMLRVAGQITGNVYKRGQYEQAIADLDDWIKANGTTGE